MLLGLAWLLWVDFDQDQNPGLNGHSRNIRLSTGAYPKAITEIYDPGHHLGPLI